MCCAPLRFRGLRLAVALQTFLAVEFDQAIDQFAHFADDNPVQLMNRQTAAMIGDPVLRKVVGADTLTTVARTYQGSPRLGASVVDQALFILQDPTFQD